MAKTYTKESALKEIRAAKAELERLEEKIENGVRDVADCSCSNPPCSGMDPVSYLTAVGGALAGGVL
nr:hypothetical protein [uncultured Cohaesibacter sp.]